MLARQVMDALQTTVLLLLLPATYSVAQQRQKQAEPDIGIPITSNMDDHVDVSHQAKIPHINIPNSYNYFTNRKSADNGASKVPLRDNYLQNVIFPVKGKVISSHKTIERVTQSDDEKLRDNSPELSEHVLSISKYGPRNSIMKLNTTHDIHSDYKKTNSTAETLKINTSVTQNTKDRKSTMSDKSVPLSRQRQTSTNNGYTYPKSSVQKRSLGDPSTCDMDITEVDVSFKERVGHGDSSYMLECMGQIRVRKCEGMCTSRVSPSVTNYDGFLRDCSCCKEETTVYRDVTLTVCFIGNEETSGRSLTRTIAEPSGCSCQLCRN